MKGKFSIIRLKLLIIEMEKKQTKKRNKQKATRFSLSSSLFPSIQQFLSLSLPFSLYTIPNEAPEE